MLTILTSEEARPSQICIQEYEPIEYRNKSIFLTEAFFIDSYKQKRQILQGLLAL